MTPDHVCLSADQIEKYFSGQLSEMEEKRIIYIIGFCPICEKAWIDRGSKICNTA